MKIKFLALILLNFSANIYTCSDKEPTQEVILVFVRQSIRTRWDTPYKDHITKITREFKSRKDALEFVTNFHELNQCTPTPSGYYSETPPLEKIKEIKKFIKLTKAEGLFISPTRLPPYLVYIEQVRTKLE